MAPSFTKTHHSKPDPSISPTRPELSARGRNVVMTGGGTGIGRAIGVAFAQAGAKSVSIVGRRLEKLKEGAEVISAAVTTDTEVIFKVAGIRKPDELSAALESIVAKVGKIDVFVSNAGSVQPRKILGYDPAKLRQGFETNVVGTLNSINAFMPYAGPEPILLNTSSGLVHTSPLPMAGAYSATKGAGTKLVDYFAAENSNVHVVNVNPGFVPTDFNGYHAAAGDSRKSYSHGLDLIKIMLI
jgi:NAD(P)-dependent dehydrogenase (short-subunit alcohol dehydrogenase family)